MIKKVTYMQYKLFQAIGYDISVITASDEEAIVYIHK